MSKSWLILDCYYLCHRAFYTMGSLSYRDVKTGVIFGFFKDIVSLMDQFGTDRIIFCFDANGSKRKEIYPAYKKKRHSRVLDENEKLALFELKRQIEKLRKVYLKTVGYNNVFWADGYEADDVIATTVAQVPEEDDAVIVSADKDMWQLIRSNVVCYNPDKGKTMSLQKFHNTYGIHPVKWAYKLALAGCDTDEVDGIPGVGEKRALLYIRGELPSTSKVYKRIESDKGLERVATNRRLVKLPYKGAPVFEIRPDNVTTEGWEKVVEELGMKSLTGKVPVMGRELRRVRSTHND